jgi:hypothetical protein
VATNISEEHNDSIFRAEVFYPEEMANTQLYATLLSSDTIAQFDSRQQSSQSQPLGIPGDGEGIKT